MEDNTISAVVETITPEMAARYLERNNINRPLNKNLVDFYASQMERGQWKLNGEAICFIKDGSLANGQHRLNAVIKAGIPIRFLVARGCDDDSFKTYDSGRNRTIADVFSICDIPNANNVSSIVNRFILMKNNYRFVAADGSKADKVATSKANFKTTKEDLLQEYYSSPELYQDALSFSKACVKKLKSFNVSEIGGLYVYLIKVKFHKEHTVRNFLNMLFFSEDVSNSTINVLRDKIVKDKMNNNGNSREDMERLHPAQGVQGADVEQQGGKDNVLMNQKTI